MSRRAGRTMRGALAAVALAGAVFAAGPTRADGAAHDGMGDYGQNRAMGGAAVAVVADNSAIEVNPAGISQLRRYALGLLYAHMDTAWTMGVSVLDSRTSPIAMGLDYRRDKAFSGDVPTFGASKRQSIHVALGEYYLERANFGLGYSYRWAHEPTTTGTRTVEAHDVHLGLIVPAHEMLRFGIVGHDFVPILDAPRDPRIAAGVGFSPLDVVVLAVDGVWHYDRGGKAWEIAAGLELVALGQLGLRGGYRHDFDRSTNLLAAGAGWFFPKGQLAYAISTEPGDRFRHTASFELNVF